MYVACCMLNGLADSSYIGYSSVAFSETKEFAKSSTDWHVCSEQTETQRGNSTSL